MSRNTTVVLMLITIFIIMMAAVAFAFPYLDREKKGELDVNWSAPTGLLLKDMTEGDTTELTYSSDVVVSVYLLKEEEADEYRSPAFYKDPLPEPVITGTNGTVKMRIEEGGDYEILIINETMSSNIEVRYSISTDSRKEHRISIISGTCLLLLSIVPAGIIYFNRFRRKQSNTDR